MLYNESVQWTIYNEHHLQWTLPLKNAPFPGVIRSATYTQSYLPEGCRRSVFLYFTVDRIRYMPPFQKCPFPRGDSVSHLVRGFGGPRESTYQMASRSVQTFLQRSLVSVQHRTERETTHGGTSVTMGTATGLASVQSNFTVSHTLCGFPNFATGQNMATVTAWMKFVEADRKIVVQVRRSASASGGRPPAVVKIPRGFSVENSWKSMEIL